MAFAIAVLMFSSAGIPPFLGFFSKFYIISSAISSGLLLYAIVAILFSVISAYYYLRVVKVMYFDEAKSDQKPITFDEEGNGKKIVLLVSILNLVMVLFVDKLMNMITNFLTF